MVVVFGGSKRYTINGTDDERKRAEVDERDEQTSQGKLSRMDRFELTGGSSERTSWSPVTLFMGRNERERSELEPGDQVLTDCRLSESSDGS